MPAQRVGIPTEQGLWGERRGSNPRHPESQSGALPTELLPPYNGPGDIISLLQVAAVPDPGTHSTACRPPKSDAKPLNPESQQGMNGFPGGEGGARTLAPTVRRPTSLANSPLHLLGYLSIDKNGAPGPIRTDADSRLSLTRRVQSATMRLVHQSRRLF